MPHVHISNTPIAAQTSSSISTDYCKQASVLWHNSDELNDAFRHTDQKITAADTIQPSCPIVLWIVAEPEYTLYIDRE